MVGDALVARPEDGDRHLGGGRDLRDRRARCGNFSKGEPPPDPSEAELEDVDFRYQCIVCGAQVVLYAAPEGEMPAPPRHCREPMLLVTPVE